MIRRSPSSYDWLLVVTALLVIVGTFAPGLALAQAAAGPADAITETEPNEHAGTATPIELDQRVRGTMRPYDTDTFAVEITQPGARIALNLSKGVVGNYTDLGISVRSPSGEGLGGTYIDGSNTSATGLVTAREAGTYYVSVTGNHARFPYEFEVSTSNIDGVPQEQNRANATPLAPDETATGTLTVDTEAWYAVNATAGDELVANLTTSERYTADVSLQLYGPNGTLIDADATSTDGTYLQTSTVVRGNGTHYVYLTRDSRTGPTPVDYALTTTVRDTADPTEPNEDRATATPIRTGRTVTGNLAAGDRDWFAFEATAGEAILPRLELAGPNQERSLQFDIYGPDGERINAYPNDAMGGDPYSAGVDVVSEPGPAEGAALAETNGTYYVRVSPGYETDNRTGPYVLSVATRRLDPFDPNQRPETATQLTPDAAVNATATAYDPDWFAFEADRGDQINVSVDSTEFTEMDIAVYGPDGTMLRSANLYEPTNVTIDAVQNGTYRVVIQQSALQMSLLYEFPYELAVDVAAGAAPPDADADRLSDAEEAEYGTNPHDADTDDDRLTDYEEVMQYRTDPRCVDTDGDGLTDYEEVRQYRTIPFATDTDEDGWSDLSEVNRGYDPNDSYLHP